MRVLILFVFIVAIAMWIFWPASLPDPKESNRVSHPAGYSIIVPPEWESSMDARSTDPYVKDRIRLRPARPGRYQPEIAVARFRKPPDLAALKASGEYRDGEFQGQAALVHDRPIKKYWVYKVLFQRDGDWFELSVALPDYEDVRNSSWYPYLNSFAYSRPSPATNPSATLPASAPTTFHTTAGK
jgi:hypothetical protein